jgi:hypothetical protein
MFAYQPRFYPLLNALILSLARFKTIRIQLPPQNCALSTISTRLDLKKLAVIAYLQPLNLPTLIFLADQIPPIPCRPIASAH